MRVGEARTIEFPKVCAPVIEVLDGRKFGQARAMTIPIGIPSTPRVFLCFFPMKSFSSSP